MHKKISTQVMILKNYCVQKACLPKATKISCVQMELICIMLSCSISYKLMEVLRQCILASRYHVANAFDASVDFIAIQTILLLVCCFVFFFGVYCCRGQDSWDLFCSFGLWTQWICCEPWLVGVFFLFTVVCLWFSVLGVGGGPGRYLRDDIRSAAEHGEDESGRFSKRLPWLPRKHSNCLLFVVERNVSLCAACQ